MIPVICQSAPSATPFGPAPTVLGVLLLAWWGFALFRHLPVERLVNRVLGVVFLVVSTSMILGFDSSGGSGGQLGQMVARIFAGTGWAILIIALLVIAALASSALATDWFFLPLLLKFRAARGVAGAPVRGTVKGYEIRGGFSHDDARGGAVIDETPAEAPASPARAPTDDELADIERKIDYATRRGAAEAAPAAPSWSAPRAVDLDADSAAGEVADVAPADARPADAVDGEDADVPWYARRRRNRESRAEAELEDSAPSPVPLVERPDRARARAEAEAAAAAAAIADAAAAADSALPRAEERAEERDEAPAPAAEPIAEDAVASAFDRLFADSPEPAAASPAPDAEPERTPEVEPEPEALPEPALEAAPAAEAPVPEVAPENRGEPEDFGFGDLRGAAAAAMEGVERAAEAAAQPAEPAPAAPASAAAPLPQRSEEDELFLKAADLVVDQKKASISFLQRSLGIGYFVAAKLLDRLEKSAIIGPYSGAVSRSVLLSAEQWQAKRAAL